MRVETKTALLACTELARAGKRTIAKDLAAAIKAPPAMLAKTLQRLARAGLLRSAKGPAGGFELAARKITVADVLHACGESVADLPYVGASYSVVIAYRRETTMQDLAHEKRGRGVAA